MNNGQPAVHYTTPAARIAHINLDHPTQGNAQDAQTTYDLNGTLIQAAHDDRISVKMLSGNAA